MERNREELEAEKSEEQPRKPYSTPRLTRHGTVDELTRSTGALGTADLIYSG